MTSLDHVGHDLRALAKQPLCFTHAIGRATSRDWTRSNAVNPGTFRQVGDTSHTDLCEGLLLGLLLYNVWILPTNHQHLLGWYWRCSLFTSRHQSDLASGPYLNFRLNGWRLLGVPLLASDFKLFGLFSNNLDCVKKESTGTTALAT